MSWIYELDFCRAVDFLLQHDLSGAVNISAPNPLPNRDFLRAYRDAWGMPLGIPSTSALLSLGAVVMNSEEELLLESRWVVPRRLLEAGFTFQYPNWPDAELHVAW
ncbi:DUF1731 domain-containing protein [Deinococcus sp. VB343]|uniref:DUF1731 domain-containing protein n=1 Tax=Deinococcus sp. VB343 TaxID=3385567 RepID=UPI0039C9208B